MKNTNYIFLLFLLTAVMTACVKTDFEAPDDKKGEKFVIEVIDEQYIVTKNHDTIPLIRIAQLKINYDSTLRLIEDNIAITGIVTANDKAGNIYKNIYIQDPNNPLMGGLNVSVDASNLSNYFMVGQRVYILCKGLYLGRYGGQQQLGYIYKNNANFDAIGRMPDILFFKNVHADGLPMDTLKPTIITSVDQLNAQLVNTYVEIQDVSFDSVNFTLAPAPPVGENPTTTERTFKIGLSSTPIYLRTSSAASFAAEKTPFGKGTIRGIYSKFQSSSTNNHQFYIRDMNDFVEGSGFYWE